MKIPPTTPTSAAADNSALYTADIIQHDIDLVDEYGWFRLTDSHHYNVENGGLRQQNHYKLVTHKQNQTIIIIAD